MYFMIGFCGILMTLDMSFFISKWRKNLDGELLFTSMVVALTNTSTMAMPTSMVLDPLEVLLIDKGTMAVSTSMWQC